MKYYNNCIFFNVQKDFIIQSGDPTGTGKGGDSVFKCVPHRWCAVLPTSCDASVAASPLRQVPVR